MAASMQHLLLALWYVLSYQSLSWSTAEYPAWKHRDTDSTIEISRRRNRSWRRSIAFDCNEIWHGLELHVLTFFFPLLDFTICRQTLRRPCFLFLLPLKLCRQCWLQKNNVSIECYNDLMKEYAYCSIILNHLFEVWIKINYNNFLANTVWNSMIELNHYIHNILM